MSRNTRRTVSGARARDASCIGRTMVAMIAADTAKVRASNVSSIDGWTTASATPTNDGSAISLTLWMLHEIELASAIRPRPTRVGIAPNTAPSKKTAIAGPRNATASTCGTVTSPIQCASGRVAISAVLNTSAVTITRFRFHRSARAPANSPNSRYGAASQAATSAVSDAESLIR